MGMSGRTRSPPKLAAPTSQPTSMGKGPSDSCVAIGTLTAAGVGRCQKRDFDMTRNRDIKDTISARMALTGEKYTKARRGVLAQMTGIAANRPTLASLLTPDLQSVLDNLVGEDLGDLGDLDKLLDGLLVHEPTLQSFEIDLSTVVIDPVENYEGGTQSCNITAHAAIIVDGLMSKGDATMAEAAGLAEVTEPDWNRQEAAVQISPAFPVQVEFSAIVTVDAESVEMLEYTGSTTDGI